MNLYTTFVTHNVECMKVGWSVYAVSCHLKVFAICQKKIWRIINKKSVDYPTSELFRQDSILNIYKMYKFKVLQNAHCYF